MNGFPEAQGFQVLRVMRKNGILCPGCRGSSNFVTHGRGLACSGSSCILCPSKAMFESEIRSSSNERMLKDALKKVKVLVTQLCPTLVTPQTLTCQAPLSMEFFKQEYWSG